MPTRSLAQAPRALELDPVQRIVESAESLAQTVVAALPRIAVALIMLVLFVLGARVVRQVLRRSLMRATDRSESFADVISGIARTVTIFLGVLVATTIVFPTVNAGSIVAGLGVTSVAIGFAFKDILQNTLAGLLLLFRRPFRIGDQIEVNDREGTVTGINVRETRIRTYDGQRVLIPNQDVYASVLVVQTGNESIRTPLLIGLDYDADLAQARDVAVAAARSVEGVMSDPPPEALYCQFNTSTIDLELRFWTAPQQAELLAVLDRVVEAVTGAYRKAGITLPTQIVEVEARGALADALDRR